MRRISSEFIDAGRALDSPSRKDEKVYHPAPGWLLQPACASGPGYKEIESQIADLEPGNGRIYFYRPSAVGAAVQPSVRLNDDVLGKAKPKGFFYVDRSEGNYVVATSTEAKRSLSLVLDEGEEKYVKLEIRVGLFVGHVKQVLVDSAEGFSDIQKLNYIGE